MRPLHETYRILINEFSIGPQGLGICYRIQLLFAQGKITENELNKLKGHFLNNKPSLLNHKEFFENESFTGGKYWWVTNTKEAKEQRLLFLEKMYNESLNKKRNEKRV